MLAEDLEQTQKSLTTLNLILLRPDFIHVVVAVLINLVLFQGFFFSILLALIGASFVSPVFFTAGLTIPSYMEDTYYCDVDWPKEQRFHYTLITTAAHYFLTLFIVIFLYTKIYFRLRSR